MVLNPEDLDVNMHPEAPGERVTVVDDDRTVESFVFVNHSAPLASRGEIFTIGNEIGVDSNVSYLYYQAETAPDNTDSSSVSTTASSRKGMSNKENSTFLF